MSGQAICGCGSQFDSSCTCVVLVVDWDLDETDIGNNPSSLQLVPADIYEQGYLDFTDVVSDWLSDQFGFCVRSWCVA